MTEPAIRVENLGKRYRIGETTGGYRTLRDSIAGALRPSMRRKSAAERRDNEFWALRNLDLQVLRGQVLGVIGRNGAGKTTFLKLLSRITEPTEGKATIRGRVGSLLEVGTGFHPELTGRENVYLNGAILGMKRGEIDDKFDEIAAFAGVERFLDTPVKRFSSGMYLRLAFSVAAHLEPEILLVDEVLAVGDAEFQRKCLGKMGEVARAGRTVLFVSHDMSSILRLTDESIVLEEGSLVMRAPSPEAVDFYLNSGTMSSGQRIWDPDEIPTDSAPFRPISLRVLDRKGVPTEQISAGKPFSVEVEYELKAAITGLRVGIYLSTGRGEPVFTSFDTDDESAFERYGTRPAGRYRSSCRIPALLLNEGRFILGLNASSFRIRSYFTDEHALGFTIEASGAPGSQWQERRRGPLRPALEWEIQEAVR